MRIAFYAPLKAPDHPVPSGDRQIARALLHALDEAGHETLIASRLRSFDGKGDAQRQARLQRIGARIAARVVRRLRTSARPDVWLTYHIYHKAPDLIGPLVTRALGIPYGAVEASVTPRQREGPWARGHALAIDAIREADTVICINPRDVPQLRRVRGHGAALDVIAPFIDVKAFTAALAGAPHNADGHPGIRLLAVAMMREGAKAASYRVLADALAHLNDVRWSLRVVGDGPARHDVERMFDGFGDRVSFAGQCTSAAIAAAMGESDLLVWPAIDEAFGVVFIEAQACGLPVIAGDSAGVAAVIDAGRTGLLAPLDDSLAFAMAIRRLASDRALGERMGIAASAHARVRHDIPAAAAALDSILRRVVRTRSANVAAHAE